MNLVTRFLFWSLDRLGFERLDIGRAGVGTYLTRWVLRGQRFGPGNKWYLHYFHRGDVEPYPHCHPWPFWSFILWGGYWEHIPADAADPAGPTRRTWYAPLCLLKRPATWKHRVELPPGRNCWTIVWTGERERGWGFWCKKRGFIPWREHEKNQAAGLPGCGEV